LQQMLPTLPADITLVTPGQLLNEPLRNGSASPAKTLPRNKPAQGFQPPGECKVKQPLSPVPATRALQVLNESIVKSRLYKRLDQLF